MKNIKEVISGPMLAMQMTVSYLNRNSFRSVVPLIRISNIFLKKFGFEVGSKIEVHYQDKEIIIRKLI